MEFIQIYSDEELEQVKKLRYQVHLEAGNILPSKDEVYTDKYDYDESVKIWCCKDQDKIVGTVRFNFEKSGHLPTDEYFIFNKQLISVSFLCVDKEYRRKNIASQLIKIADQYLNTNTRLVAVVNHESINAFLKCGWKKIGEEQFHQLLKRIFIPIIKDI